MFNVCIVEDEVAVANQIKSYIMKYESENNEQITIHYLPDGIDLVDEYHGQFDVILLDIQMKHMDGMSAAEKIRHMDSDVIIIFITSTIQYAVQGYTVDALGYMLKPVPYSAFEKLMEKALARVNAKKERVYIKASVDNKQIKLDCNTIFYLESQRNNVIVHGLDENYITGGPLRKFDEQLTSHGFCKCHNAYLVNLSFVVSVKKEEVELANGKKLPISRARKKEFMAALAEDIL